jgi:hypothetical protein
MLQEIEDRIETANQPDGANRRQPLGLREAVGEVGFVDFTAAVAHPHRYADEPLPSSSL